MNSRFQDFSVRRGSLFKITLRTSSIVTALGGPILVKIVKWIVLELSVTETLLTLVGLKGELADSRCWEEQGRAGSRQRGIPRSLLPSLSSWVPCLLPFKASSLPVVTEGYHQHLGFTVLVSIPKTTLIDLPWVTFVPPDPSLLRQVKSGDRSARTIRFGKSEEGKGSGKAKQSLVLVAGAALWFPTTILLHRPCEAFTLLSLPIHCPAPISTLSVCKDCCPLHSVLYSLQIPAPDKDGMHKFGAAERNIPSTEEPPLLMEEGQSPSEYRA